MRVDGYVGVRFASWVLSIVNVVKLEIVECEKCWYLPPLDRLPSLQKLHLERLPLLECIVLDMSSLKQSSLSPRIPFFPSLKIFLIWNHPELVSMPLFSYFEFISLKNTSLKPLEQTIMMKSYGREASSSSSSCSPSPSKLENVSISGIEDSTVSARSCGQPLFTPVSNH
ncbi:hypothetical protein FEM48_Zijuj06G0212700 [Ziziphus jujuba var. spinosa]|uniref:R13L1/DRL21-like LRR repeat region domain-containing protein n=1 Tax=Ziziphus jujuba var. spinosa TaxID=714518 RepID=A0A978VBN9_ZIZJJ|nr:hypothetical protein FEM48_Zijuj06G0212700 [Ziziphus jujuba var. spinosa]